MRKNIEQLRESFERIRPWITLSGLASRLDELIKDLEDGKKKPQRKAAPLEENGIPF